MWLLENLADQGISSTLMYGKGIWDNTVEDTLIVQVVVEDDQTIPPILHKISSNFCAEFDEQCVMEIVHNHMGIFSEYHTAKTYKIWRYQDLHKDACKG